MSFGNDLDQVFDKLTEGVLYHEEELTTKLQDSFAFLGEGKYKRIVRIIHGNRSFVRYSIGPRSVFLPFSPYKPIPLSSERRFEVELGDMMFLVYNKKQARLTILQNKRSNEAIKKDGTIRFEADLNQLMLLAFRPMIKYSTKDTFIERVFGESLLNKALLPSVGSYGVFYKNEGKIEMQYYPANRIKYSPDTYKKKQMVQFGPMNGEPQFDFYDSYSVMGFDEVIGTKSITEFGDNLVSMRIGTPVSKQAIKDLLGFIQPEETSSGTTTGRASAAAFQRAPQTNRAKRPIVSCCKTMIFIDASMIETESYRNDNKKN